MCMCMYMCMCMHICKYMYMLCMCMYGFRDAPKGSDHVSFRFQRILFFCFLFFSLAIASSALGVAMLLSSATVPITYDYLRIMVQTNAVDW